MQSIRTVKTAQVGYSSRMTRAKNSTTTTEMAICRPSAAPSRSTVAASLDNALWREVDSTRRRLGAAGACVHGKGMEQHGPAVLTMLKTAEIAMGEFLLPWGMVISALGFLAAWLVVFTLERLRLTRFLWNLPLFFIALSVLLGSVIGIILSP